MSYRDRWRARFILAHLAIVLTLLSARASADFTFGEPVNLGPSVNSPYSESAPTMTADGLELYFNSDRPVPDLDMWNIWVVTRQTPDDDWGEPTPLSPEINSAFEDDWPQLSPDGLELYFSRKPPDGPLDIWVTRRPKRSEPWGPAVNLGLPINSPDAHEYSASITADGRELYFSTNRPDYDIWVAKRATKDEPWGNPVNLGAPVNSSASDCLSCISGDGLVLCFSSHPAHTVRPGGTGRSDIWVTTRPTRDAPWREPWNPGPPLNTTYSDSLPTISLDGRWLYFSDFWWSSAAEVRPGGYASDDLWKAPIRPIVDFNGDEVVDSRDVEIMLYYWGQNEPMCDIGPMPWGDGAVDVEDMIVLTRYLEPGLECVAHWKLDESRGPFAHDSVGGGDATVAGNPSWRPDEGKVDGALLLDGVDDYVSTDFVMNPHDGPVRVVAWIKTDVAGTVIVSQAPGTSLGSTWLGTDPSDGTLMTGMLFPMAPLPSDTVVADGQWHEVAVEWDGTYRRLWVGAQEVASDPSPVEPPPLRWDGALNIGVGEQLEPGTFFSGLIDDVRVYAGAVMP